MLLVSFDRWGNWVLEGGMSSHILRSKPSHRSRFSVEGPCQQSSCELPSGSVLVPQKVVAGKFCMPPTPMSPSPLENEYRGNCAQGQWLPGPHCEGFHEWELEAQGSYGKLLATAAHLQKAWCWVHHSREDLPHSLGACSPEAFFFFCDLFFCNPLRVRYSTRFQVNGEVEWKSKNEDC